MGSSTWGVVGAVRCMPVMASILLAGCAAEPMLSLEQEGILRSALAADGAWTLPEDVRAFGDTQFVDYTGAGYWTGSDSCQGGMTSGADDLREYLYTYFPQLSLVGGYACRHINGDSSRTSVHATGRALDLHIPLAADGAADNDLGDPIAHWLIQNAESIGIQFIIWDRSTWSASRRAGEKFRPYTGASPHRDHLHIELSLAGAAQETSWFSEDWASPQLRECAALGPQGGVIDDLDGCAQIMGPTRYWRHEVGQGYQDSLFWTHAVEGAEHANWARWQINMEEAGQYELEVYIAPEFAIHQAARYQLTHAAQHVEIEIDQSRAEAWHSMGLFEFSAGMDQYLALYDNNEQEVAEGQRISADAIRLTRIEVDSPKPEEPVVPTEPESAEPEEQARFGNVTGGCSMSGTSSHYGWICTLFALLAMRRRRALLPIFKRALSTD